MVLRRLGILICWAGALCAQETLIQRARHYLADLVRLDTSNPPGNETRVAAYLKRIADEEGIPCEVLGADPARLNFVARLAGSGGGRPLLLMAHSDVVPAERARWSVAPFSGELRDRILHGRGALDDKSLLAAELAVMVEFKRTAAPLRRDIVLLAEADEESGSSGIQWLVRNEWKKIDAEFALNEGGYVTDLGSGTRLFEIQTAEKIPTPVLLRAAGTAGHGSLPLTDNAVVRVARAVVRLSEADQPVRLTASARRYFTDMAKLPEYAWLEAFIPRLLRPQTAMAAANEIRARDPEFDAQLRTTVSPDVIHSGSVVNVIPSTAEAQVDVRRLPSESRQEVLARLRKIVHDDQVEVLPVPGHNMPSTEPSSVSTMLYRVMETVLRKSHPKSMVVPYMQRGATDGSYLRQKGMAVYGVPLFIREDRENRAHGVDERISLDSLDAGTRMLLDIVRSVAADCCS